MAPLRPLAAALILVACQSTAPSSQPADAAALVTDASATDALPPPRDDGPAPQPYDAGPAPPCARTASLRRVAARSDGVRDLRLGGLAAYRGGFLVALQQGAARAAADAGSARRDTVDLVAVDHDAQVQRPLEPVYASAPMGTDLAPPALVSLGGGATALFGESRGRLGGADFLSRLRGVVVDNGGVAGVPAALLEQHGQGVAAPLPDGRALLIASRIRSVSPDGVAVVSPTAYRVGADGTLASGQDITAYLRLDSDSLLLRGAPQGAVLFARVAGDLYQLGFEASGGIDPRGGRTTPGIGADRFDDAAVLDDVSVLVWGASEDGMGVVRAAVVRRDGALVARRELDRFRGADPVVAAARAYGGAAIAWLRGAGDTLTVRAATLQPDGIVRGEARDIVRAPNADGRLHLLGDDGSRVVTFAVRETDGLGVPGVSVGRACLP